MSAARAWPSRIGLRLGVPLVLLATWQLVATLAGDPARWPPADAVLRRLWELWIANPEAWRDSVVPSLARLGVGWGAAALLGVTIGVLIGLSPRARETVEPVAAFVRAIPPPALLPLFIVLLGIGDAMKVTMIAIGVVWPVLLNTADGVASVDPLHRDGVRAYRIGRFDAFARVILPSAAPKIFAGLRVSLSIAVILMVISEMVATVNGIGFELVQAQRGFRTVDAWATVLLLGIIGLVLNAVLGSIEARAIRWQGGAGANA